MTQLIGIVERDRRGRTRIAGGEGVLLQMGADVRRIEQRLDADVPEVPAGPIPERINRAGEP